MSDMQFRCRKVQSVGLIAHLASMLFGNMELPGYSQAWQKAMAAWPRAMLDQRRVSWHPA